MPPKDKKDQKPLTPEELGLLKLWIDAGAKDDSAENKPSRPSRSSSGRCPRRPADRRRRHDRRRRRVAAGRANVVQVYDADSGLEIVSLGGHKDIIQSLRFSPDGKRLAAGSYQFVTLWDVPSGGLAKTFDGHNDQVKALAVSADGKTAYSGGLDSTDPRLERRRRQADPPARASPAQVLALALAPTAKRSPPAAPTTSSTCSNAADGKERVALKGHSGPVHGLALPARRQARSSRSRPTAPRGSGPCPPTTRSSRQDPNEVKAAEPFVLNGHRGPVRAVAVTPDGQTVATGGDDEIDPALARRGRQAIRHARRARRARPGPGGQPRREDAAGGFGRQDRRGSSIWPTGKLHRTLGRARRPGPGGRASPRGRPAGRPRAAEGGVKVWDAASGQGVIAFGHTAPNNAADPAAAQGRVHRRRGARLGLGRPDPEELDVRGHLVRAEAARAARLPRPGDRLQPRRQADRHRRRRAVALGRGQDLGRRQGRCSSARSTRSIPTPSSAVRFSPDGTKLATRRGRQVPQGRRTSPTARS